MKFDFTKYIELVVHHEDASFSEYPSRFCVIRVPILSDGKLKEFSLGQVRKLIAIGMNYSNVLEYFFVPHRPFDKNFLIHYMESDIIDFRVMFQLSFNLFHNKGLI